MSRYRLNIGGFHHTGPVVTVDLSFLLWGFSGWFIHMALSVRHIHLNTLATFCVFHHLYLFVRMAYDLRWFPAWIPYFGRRCASGRKRTQDSCEGVSLWFFMAIRPKVICDFIRLCIVIFWASSMYVNIVNQHHLLVCKAEYLTLSFTCRAAGIPIALGSAKFASVRVLVSFCNASFRTMCRWLWNTLYIYINNYQ